VISLRIGTVDLVRRELVYQAGPTRIQQIISRVLNHVGGTARTKVKSTLAKQMGLPAGTVDARLITKRAYPGNQTFEITAVGRPIPLADFDARQTRRGVSARPWGARRMFPGTFIVSSLGGQVFRRTGRARLPIVKLWGPSIPREMLRDQVPKVFFDEVHAKVPVRLQHELRRILVTSADFTRAPPGG
jgi:hypothetical protein